MHVMLHIMKHDLFELYTDYLLSSFGQTTATGLSAMLDGAVSHDQVTRFLSSDDFDSIALWKHVKKTVREIESEDGVLIFDDTIQAKPHTDESELVCWHFDHTQGRSVKGINLLNCLYHSGDVCVPVSFEMVKKPYVYCDIETRKVKRRSERTKNEMVRDMLAACQKNQLKYQYVLFDIWFSSSDNMRCIVEQMGKHFVSAVKANRLVAHSEADKLAGRFVHISDLDYSKQTPLKVWVKGLHFAVLAHRQVFINKDGSQGVLYLMCSDLGCDQEGIETIYQKRWKVEVYHKTLKQNANLAKSPTRRVRTQSNHIFLSICAAFKLECLSIRKQINHFALKRKLLVKATKSAYEQLTLLRAAA